jgi:ligand-binding sensor domain-containing protein/signal transduction histidine kinase
MERAVNAGQAPDEDQWSLHFVDIGMPAKSSDDTRVEALLRDRRGVLWIASPSGLYRLLPDGRSEHYTVRDGLPFDHVTSLLQDREGTLWAGTWEAGLGRISITQNSTASVERVSITKVRFKGEVVRSMLESSDGRFWLGAGGLYELLNADGHERLELRATAFGLGAGITALKEDRAGNIWLGSRAWGAAKIARHGFVNYTEEDGLASKRILSVFEDRRGTLCVETSSSIRGDPARWVNWSDGRRFHGVRPNIPREVKGWGWGWYQLTLQDHKGKWWVPTLGGLFRFRDVSSITGLGTARPSAVFKPGDPAHEEVFRVFEDSRGDIWIGTTCGGASRLMRWERATGNLRRYGEALGDRLPSAFAEDRAGNIWVGFINGGLARYREGSLQFFGPAEGVPDDGINALYLDSQGRLWAASARSGVTRTDSPEAAVPAFATITTAQGLSSNHARCITEDRWGRIYVGADRGVDSFYPRTPLRVRHYTTADGLPGGEMIAAFRDRQGALWFGKLGGLSRFEPQPDQPEPVPPIVISSLRVRGEQRPISALGETEVSGLVLGANQNQVQVDFVSPHFNPGAPLRYQYRLEDVDTDWSKPSEERSVNFATLPAGSYTFLVRAVTIDGLVSDRPASLAFTVLAPYWAQWWFRVLALLVLAGTIYAAFRFRLGRLLEIERLRSRIATDLHDDIGASLSRIAIMSEVLIRRAGSEKNGLTSQLSDIAGGAREMIASMSDIVWAINPSHDQLRDLVQRMRRFASDVLSARDIEFVFRAPADQELKMDADTRRQLFLVFKEAINNIARHSGCKRVEIELARDRDGLVLRIQDDGKGLAAAAAAASGGGHGLPSMQARAGLIGGDIAIASEPGRGTSITIRVPT